MFKTHIVIQEVKKVIEGKDDVIEKILMAILAQGHVLLEDVPGVGKTSLALAFSKAMDLKYKRTQFTPDVMPSDVVGFSTYNKQTGKLEYHEGAALCNLYLADEINRTSSKTQSALLEVMAEGKITVDGETHDVPRPYTVIATQNPFGSLGTQMLPESQLDRFMIKCNVGYPDEESMLKILKARDTENPLDSVAKVVNEKDIIKMQDAVLNIHVSDEIYQYITQLIEATRKSESIALGVSPRGALALAKMAKAHAYIKDRDYVIPQDVQNVFCDVCGHRIVMSAQAKIGNVNPNDLLKELLDSVKAPEIK